VLPAEWSWEALQFHQRQSRILNLLGDEL
jgi:hypothetical protein